MLRQQHPHSRSHPQHEWYASWQCLAVDPIIWQKIRCLALVQKFEVRKEESVAELAAGTVLGSVNPVVLLRMRSVRRCWLKFWIFSTPSSVYVRTVFPRLVTWHNKWMRVKGRQLYVRKGLPIIASLNELFSLTLSFSSQKLNKPEMLETKKSRLLLLLPDDVWRRGTNDFASLAEPSALILIISSYVSIVKSCRKCSVQNEPMQTTAHRPVWKMGCNLSSLFSFHSDLQQTHTQRRCITTACDHLNTVCHVSILNDITFHWSHSSPQVQ